MTNVLHLLRHGKVNVDPSKPASKWTLSNEGIKEVLGLVKNKVLSNMNFIYSSEEEKAYHTARIIADSIGKKVVRIYNFNELDRKSFSENYESAVKEAFSNITKPRNNWESCLHALERFIEGIELVTQRHENNKILIVSHGIVLTLYFAHLKGDMNSLFSRWRKLGFLSYGIAENSRIIKDIVCQNFSHKSSAARAKNVHNFHVLMFRSSLHLNATWPLEEKRAHAG